MQVFLLTLHLFLALLLIGIVLLQRSEGGGLGIGGGMADMMGSRGGANFLTRATAILAGLFMVSALLLTITVEDRRSAPSILDIEDEGQTLPVTPPQEPFTPLPVVPIE